MIERTDTGSGEHMVVVVATRDVTTRHVARCTGASVEFDPPIPGWMGREAEKLARSLLRRGKRHGMWWRPPPQA
ncbi:MAG: hypothetical protein D6705_00285 [Deltaproteobacteria bacterium]|nr:MAG: hypothetical protein D6705_00285 [Deltaproteobacteria bacterium]